MSASRVSKTFCGMASIAALVGANTVNGPGPANRSARSAATIAAPGREPVTFVAESPPGVLATSLPVRCDGADDEFWVSSIWLCPEFGLKRLSDLRSDERDARPDHWSRIGVELRRYLSNSDAYH